MQNGSAQIQAYDPFRAQLGELKTYNESVTFDYESKSGNKEARSHIYKLRQTKSAVEKARKAEKAEALEYGRQVDAQAKEIMGEIESMIEVHQRPIDEIEQREKERQAKHEARIAEMQELAMESNEDFSAAVLRDRLKQLETYKLGEHWEEYEVEASRVKEAGIEALKSQIARREKYEAEQAELEKLRREQQEREKKDREAQIAKEAEDRAHREAEQKAKQEREAAERRELQLKLEKEQAERRAEQAAEEARREADAAKAKEEAEAKRREENKKHKAKIHREAVAGLVDGGIPDEQAKDVVTLIAKGLVPNVRVVY